MKDWLRRVRGALGMGMAWALGWAPIGAVLGGALWAILDPPVGLMSVVEINALAFGALGFIGGTLFSSVLLLADGRQCFGELKMPRFAAWGAAGGLLLGGFAVFAGFWGSSHVPFIGMTVLGAATLLGAGSAAGSLALAREADDRELRDAGEDGAAVGPVERDGQHLLG